MDWWNRLDNIVSRNWDDDIFEEEDTTTGQAIILQWDRPSHGKLNIGTLIIGSLVAASVFLEVQFPERKEIGTIIIPDPQVNKILKRPASSPQHSAKIYTTDSSYSTCIIICSHEIPTERLYEWTQVLFDHISVNRVFVLDTISHFSINCVLTREGTQVTIPSLRCLYTEPVKKSIGHSSATIYQCPLLESPQVIDKLPAAVLTHCQLHYIEAVLYLSVEDDDLLRTSTIIAYEDVVSKILGRPVQQHRSQEYSKVLRKYPARSTLSMFC